MIKIRMLATGEVIEVTNNVGFGLVDSGKAEMFSPKPYVDRKMRPAPMVNQRIYQQPRKKIGKGYQVR